METVVGLNYVRWRNRSQEQDMRHLYDSVLYWETMETQQGLI